MPLEIARRILRRGYKCRFLVEQWNVRAVVLMDSIDA
jgi:hypothetical protein